MACKRSAVRSRLPPPSEQLKFSAKADVKKKASQSSVKKLEYRSSLLTEVSGEMR